MSILGHSDDDKTPPNWPPLRRSDPPTPWTLVACAFVLGAVPPTIMWGPEIDALAPGVTIGENTTIVTGEAMRAAIDRGGPIVIGAGANAEQRPKGTGLYPAASIAHGCVFDAGASQVFDFGVHLGEALPGESCDAAIARLENAGGGDVGGGAP